MFDKPINDVTPSELKQSLKDFITRALKLGHEMRVMAAKLEAFGPDVRFRSFGVCLVDDCLSRWITNIEKQATDENAAGTSAEIRLCYIDAINYPTSVPGGGFYSRVITLRDKWMDAEGSLETQFELLELLLADIRFDAMAKNIREQAGALVSAGYRQAADKIAGFLGLVGRSSKAPTLTDRGYVFESYHGGSSRGMERYDFMRELSSVADEVAVAEEYTGISGVQAALSNMHLQLFRADNNIDLPAQYSMGSPGVLSAKVFKNKTRFVLEQERADALLSFITEYGNTDRIRSVA